MNSESFKFKARITGRDRADGNKKYVEMVVPLKYLSNFFSNLEMPLINCEINLMLTWSVNCFITNSANARTYVRNNTKRYALVVTSSTQGNTELLQQLNLGFKRTINWNKYLSKQLMEVKFRSPDKSKFSRSQQTFWVIVCK